VLSVCLFVFFRKCFIFVPFFSETIFFVLERYFHFAAALVLVGVCIWGVVGMVLHGMIRHGLLHGGLHSLGCGIRDR